MKTVLDNIALAVLGDQETLRREKMSQKSYWKWILRSYRGTMSDFDTKMEMCAAFYAHTQKAVTVVATTQLKLQQMRGELVVYRDALQEAPLELRSGKTVSLQLYLNILKEGVNNLEATRKATKLLKREKVARLEESLQDQGWGHSS